MRRVLAITKAISDINRVRILCALAERGELCVCQIQEMLALAPSSTSKHLSVLANAGIVSVRKTGRWAFYRVPDAAEIPEEASGIVEWLRRQTAREKRIAEDRERLDQILSYSPEELCLRQAQGLECCSCAPETPAAARSPKATRGRSRRT